MLIAVEGHTHGRRQAVNGPFSIRDAAKVSARLGPELDADARDLLRAAGYDATTIERLVAGGVLAG